MQVVRAGDIVGEHTLWVDGLEKLGFDETVLSWSVDRLSSGERQRLALLRLLANQPQALLLDEPTANLDASNVGQAETLISSYRVDRQAPVLWVSHDAGQIARVASRHYELANGRLSEIQ